MHSEASGDTLASSGDTRFCMRVQQLSRRQVARSRSRWSLPVRAALQLWARVLSKGLLPGELESPPPPTAASFGDLQLIILHMMPSPPPQRLGIGLATVALPHVLTATLSPPLALLTLAATARRHSPSPPPRSRRRRLALAAATSPLPPPHTHMLKFGGGCLRTKRCAKWRSQDLLLRVASALPCLASPH